MGKKTPTTPLENPEPKKKGDSFSVEQRRARKQSFLDAFPEYGTTYHTAKFCNIPIQTIYWWLEKDSDFAEAFKQVQRVPGYFVERAALQRARDVRSNADTLRIFFLKNLLRDKYGEADRLTIEIKIQETLVSAFVSLIQRMAPNFCPSCKTHLGLPEKLAKELLAMSETMTKTGGLLSASSTAGTQEIA